MISKNFHFSEENYKQLINNITSDNDEALKEFNQAGNLRVITREVILHETIREGVSEEVAFELKPEPSEINSMHNLQEEHSSKREGHLQRSFSGRNKLGSSRSERDESGERSSRLFWRGRQNLIFSDLVDQRKEFESDTKCNGNLVKEFKKKNAGLD